MFRTLRFTALVLLVTAGASYAQDTPAVFVHGLNSHADTWSDAAATLPQRFAITAHLPDPDWSATFEEQADHLQRTLGSLPSNTLAIGHSNGGLVSRQWSRSHPLGAIVTVGTPHGGAPLVNHLPDWLNFNNDIITLVNIAGARIGWLNSNWWWLANSMYTLLKVGGDMASISWWQATVGLGINASIPVVREMGVGSSYINDITNDASREAAAIPYRIGIANTTTDYRMGGPFRATSDPLLYRNLVWALAGAMDFYGWYLIGMSDPADIDAQSAGWSLLNVSTQFWGFEEVWCRAVSDAHPLSIARCEDNDVIVPTSSQQFPGGITLFRTGNFTHIDETTHGIDWLADALANFVHVPERGAASSGGSSGTGPTGPVTFYEHINFSGASFSSSSGADFVGWDWNDRVSSVRIPPGMSLVLYQDWYHEGQSITLSGDVADLRNYGGPGLDGSWNDSLSSYAIVGTVTGGSSGSSGSTSDSTGDSVSSMQANSAIRGCENYIERAPVFQPSASACQTYCSQNGANACEWHESGSCYVEFGSSCYVEPGYAGWSAAVLSNASTPARLSHFDERGGPARAVPQGPLVHERSRTLVVVWVVCVASLVLAVVAGILQRRIRFARIWSHVTVPVGWATASAVPIVLALTLLRRGLPGLFGGH